jgi:hypothetical protein
MGIAYMGTLAIGRGCCPGSRPNRALAGGINVERHISGNSSNAEALPRGKLYGEYAMSRDEDGISNAYWLIFASGMTAVAVAIGAIVASIA